MKLNRAHSQKTRRQKSKHWFFCEGLSEKLYFEEVSRAKGFSIEACSKTNFNKPIQIFRDADDEIKKRIKNREFLFLEPDGLQDYVWLVFDRDDNTDQELTELTNKVAHLNKETQNKDISYWNILYSNPCFEFWYRLHFGDTARSYQSSRECKEEIKTSRFLPGYKESISYFDRLGDEKLRIAIDAAKRLVATYKGNQSLYVKESHPVSTVYEFFEFLDKQSTPN